MYNELKLRRSLGMEAILYKMNHVYPAHDLTLLALIPVHVGQLQLVGFRSSVEGSNDNEVKDV